MDKKTKAIFWICMMIGFLIGIYFVFRNTEPTEEEPIGPIETTTRYNGPVRELPIDDGKG